MFSSKTEDGAIYGKAFDVTKAALSKWQLPEVIQVHLDWFPGSRSSAKAHFPHVRVKRGMEHLRRNLLHNQGPKKKKKNKTRSPKAKAVSQRRARGFDRPEPDRVAPKLNRNIYSVLNVLSELMWAPTAAYVEVCLELFLRRVADVLDENPDFATTSVGFIGKRKMSRKLSTGKSKFGCQNGGREFQPSVLAF